MFRVVTVLLGLGVATPALAKEEAVPVKIVVVDGETKPIGTAVIRHPEEQDRHPVNPVTGHWEADRLYMLDGSELVFMKDLELKLEITAPGYLSKAVVYKIRKRKNVVTVPLEKLNLEELESEDEDPVISFGRDKPLDGMPIEEEGGE